MHCEVDTRLADIQAKTTCRLDNPPLRTIQSLKRFVIFEKEAMRLRCLATTFEDRHSITRYQIELAVETLVDLFGRPWGIPRRSCRKRNDSFVELVKRIEGII